jgi:hypothetical protein
MATFPDSKGHAASSAEWHPNFVCFFFTKFRFGLLALVVHGFLNLLYMDSLKTLMVFYYKAYSTHLQFTNSRI